MTTITLDGLCHRTIYAVDSKGVRMFDHVTALCVHEDSNPRYLHRRETSPHDLVTCLRCVHTYDDLQRRAGDEFFSYWMPR